MSLGWASRCGNNDCPGFGVFDSTRHGLEIEKCDDCNRFPSDEEALLWLSQNLHRLRLVSDVELLAQTAEEGGDGC